MNNTEINTTTDSAATISSAAETSEVTIAVEPSETFVVTPPIQRITDRALAYLKAGYPIHFCGPAGTGKTTLAMHVAAMRGRSVMLMHGDDEFSSSDLVGGEYGYRKSKVVDNFIHSVVKTEESMNTLWTDNRLTLACRNGDTLVYDEFTRSRPEANNALLSVLEEKLLTLPRRRQNREGYMDVHSDFRAIFTSNPEEYAGVHRTQDALMDRLITIKLDYLDRDTEVRVVRSKSGLPQKDAEVIVDIVRGARNVNVTKHGPSMRASIMIAIICAQQNARARANDPMFREVCQDVLAGPTAKVVRDNQTDASRIIDELLSEHARGTRVLKKRQTMFSASADIMEQTGVSS
jgi:nitric oxide reductase NorQ protein